MKNNRPKRRRKQFLLAAIVLLFGTGLAVFAAAQSGSASRMSLNSPISFPVDI